MDPNASPCEVDVAFDQLPNVPREENDVVDQAPVDGSVIAVPGLDADDSNDHSFAGQVHLVQVPTGAPLPDYLARRSRVQILVAGFEPNELGPLDQLRVVGALVSHFVTAFEPSIDSVLKEFSEMRIKD